MEKKKRYNIGLIVGNVEDDFSNQVCRGAMRAAELVDDNLFIIPMKYLGQAEEAKNDLNQQYEYQYNFLAAYGRSKSLDMILLCLSTIVYRSTEQECEALLRTFDGVPVMLIASKHEKYSSINYDNVTGLGMGIRYLIEERNCNHIGMLTGPAYIDDARERLEVYKSVLAEKGLPIEDRKIVYGEYNEKCRADVEKLLVNNPDLDAIVCANDAMAQAVYQVLDKYHFAIGKDICVLGFDDIEDSAYMEPPLATVRADASVLGYRAMVECHGMLEEHGKQNLPVKQFVVETAFVKRESASGVKARKKSLAEDEKMEYIKRLNMMIDMNHRMNIVNRDMLMFVNSSDQNYARFLEALSIDAVSSCYLFTMNKPLEYHRNQPMRLPNAMYLRAYKKGTEVVELPRAKQRIPIHELFDSVYASEDRKSYVMIDMYSRELQYGILVCDMPYQYFHYLELLCYQISIAMKIKELFSVQEKLLEDKEDMLQKLERENLLLDDISNKDELTGILNRRGFIAKVGKMMQKPENQGKNAVMVFMDLNYLKLINDKYTHAEGNFAIRSCAAALEASVGQSGVTGRIGGDEFVGCALVEEAGDGVQISAQVKQILSDLNVDSGKPYEVMASVGVCEFSIEKDADIKALMEEADEDLYEDKSKKGPFIERVGK